VGQGLKVELAGFPFLAQDHVVALVGADRHALVGQVRHPQQRLVELALDLAQLFVQLADAVAHLAHLSDLGLTFLRVLHTADLF
jgi:hypothetical protein